MLERLNILLELGGPVLMTLVVLSIVAVSIIAYKSLQFIMLLGQGKSFVSIVLKHYRAHHYEDALRILARNRSPVARVMDVAIVGHGAASHQANSFWLIAHRLFFLQSIRCFDDSARWASLAHLLAA